MGDGYTREDIGRILELKRRIEQLEAERKRLRGLLWYGWSEMNAIRARSGVPLDFDGTTQCIAESYWGTLVEAMSSELGDETTPWPSDAAKSAVDFAPLDQGVS